MKRTLFAALAFAMVVGVAIVLPLSSAHALTTFVAETETKIYKPDKSYGGYFMPTDLSAGSTHYLMDMMGNVVHQITARGGVPILTEEGNWSGIGTIQDWDGNLIWDFNPSRDAGRENFPMHHDAKRIFNKKLNQWTQLINCNRTITQAEAVAMGMDPGVTYGSRLGGVDFVIEVNMAKQIVWEWHPWEHGVQSVNPAWPNYATNVNLKPGRLDVNWTTDQNQPVANGNSGIRSDWFHVNAVDYDEDVDHVAINEKHWSQFIVIDHGKTFVSTTDFSKNVAAAAGPDGDIIYRWGNPSSYNAGKGMSWNSEGDSQMTGAHNIQFIRPYHWYRPHLTTDKWPDPATGSVNAALPGAGNFLIFDNNCYNTAGRRSRVHEINPRIGASGVEEVVKGKYIDPVVAGYTSTSNTYRKSRQLVYSYASQQHQSFYSSHISGAQRLPNGNTSINSGNQGLMFEVMPSGEVVWQYQYPMGSIAGQPGVFAKQVASDGTLAFQDDDGFHKNQPSIYRHYRYGVDHPGLAGKDLTPTGTLTALEPRLIGAERTPQSPTFGFGIGSRQSYGGGGGGGAAGGGGGGGY